MSRISDTLAGWSLTKTRVRPSAVCTRCRMMSPSSSMALSARSARAGWLRGTSKAAVTWPLRRAVAHQRSVAARAERQRQRIEQDRFAGAGFAGQHRKAGGEIDVQPFDQDDIADRQVREHAESDRGLIVRRRMISLPALDSHEPPFSRGSRPPLCSSA